LVFQICQICLLYPFPNSDRWIGDFYLFQITEPKAKFKLTFPIANVKETTTVELIDDKEVEIFHYTANMQGRDHINLAYQLDYIFLPDIESKEDLKSLFDEQRDYLLSAANAELEFEKIIEKNDAPS
jgi:hypothetical protein